MWLSWRIQHAFPHCVLSFSCLNHLLKSTFKETFDVPPKRSHFWFPPFQWITTPSSSCSDQQSRSRIWLISFSLTPLPTRWRIYWLCLQHRSTCRSHSTTLTATTLVQATVHLKGIKEPPNGWIFLPPPLTLYSPPSSQREPGKSDQQLRSLLKTFQQVLSQRRSQSPPLWYVPLWSSPPACLAHCVSHSSLPTVPRQGQELGPCQWLPLFLRICTPPPSGPRSAAIPDEALALPFLHFSA